MPGLSLLLRSELPGFVELHPGDDARVGRLVVSWSERRAGGRTTRFFAPRSELVALVPSALVPEFLLAVAFERTLG